MALAVGLAVEGGAGGFGFGGVAAIWAYDREALAAADATLRAEVATCDRGHREIGGGASEGW